MKLENNIPIRNIYYMLTYAFKELKHNNYEHIVGEDFDNIYDLFAEILSNGISYLLKQGLLKEYITKNDVISTLKGKLDIQETIKEQCSLHMRLACEFDQLTVNNIYNQIIKTTVCILINQEDINKERKTALKKLMFFFNDVDDLNVENIRWNRLRYDRNSRTYQMLHSMCYFVLHNKLLSTEDGNTKLPKFSDEHVNLLFQRFVMEYYKKHHPEYRANAKRIKWNFSDASMNSSSILPIMQSDITLMLGDRTLIIDTKYYSKNLNEYYGKLSINSPNIYQIYTYVMNEDKYHIGNVDGMLLYAQTVSDVQPYGNYTTNDGNLIMVRTIDLSKDFSCIKRCLENLVTEHLKK